MFTVPGLLGLARRPVARDLTITFGGRVVQMLLALLGSIASARALGPEDLGRFGLVMTTIMICGTLADGGLTYTCVKFIAQYAATDPERARAVGRSYLALRVIAGSAVALLGFVVSAPLASVALGHPDLTPYLQLAFATVFSLGLSSYPGMALTGLGSFGRLGLASVFNAAITVAGILALFALGRLELTALIAWNVALPLVSTLPAWFLLPREWLPWRRPRGESARHVQVAALREVLGFNKWMLIATLGTVVAVQGDVILLGRLAGPATVGVYTVALALALRLDTLNQSLLTVMLPRASRLQGSTAIEGYARRVFGGTLLMALGLALLALAAQPLIVLFYGEGYVEAAGLFLALAAVALFDLVTSSLFLLALPLNRPRVLAASYWLQVGVLGVAGWLLIPLLAGYGAAAARFLARVVGALYTFGALRRAVGEGATTADEELEPLASTEWA